MSIDVTGTSVFVCMVTDLVVERGVAALVGGEQVALFRVADHEVLAVQQEDPFSGAHVMSRGLVGTRGDRLTVASPMHKQVFDLRSGCCIDSLGGQPMDLRVWRVQVSSSGHVLVDTLPGGDS